MNNSYNVPVAVLSNRKTTLPIFNLPTVMGRNDQAVDVYLYHESISREHCMFEYLEGMFTIKDLGSTVGTFVNGSRLEPGIPYSLESGSKLKIGKLKFNVEVNLDELNMRAQAGFASPQQAAFGEQAAFAPDMTPPMQNPIPQQSEDEPSIPGERRIVVEVRALGEYDYDESEVEYIDCGISSDDRPLTYTGSMERSEVEEALQEDSVEEESIDEASVELSSPDIRDTQAMDMEEAEEALAEAEEEVVSNLLEADDEATVILSCAQAAQTEESKDDEEAVKKTSLSWIDDESGEIMRLVIDSYPFSIGRKSDENDYAIRRKGISRRHMTFDIIDGDVCICDENSTNGVRLRGERLEPGEYAVVESGDGIRAGGITFAVKIDE